MKKVLAYAVACMSIFLWNSVKSQAQNPEKQPTPEEMALQVAEGLEKKLKLEDWQVFYVDSTLQHDYAALDAELKSMQEARVGNFDLYQEVQDKWMDQIDNSFKKWFTPEQWKKYLKGGAGKAQKAREKRRLKREAAAATAAEESSRDK